MSDLPRYTHDDDLITATAVDAAARVRVYRLDRTTVVIGAGGKLDREVHADACASDGVPILRRPGGGCAVVLDPGNVVVSATAPADRAPGIRRSFDLVSAWLIRGLAAVGIPGVTQAGVSDLALDGRKIAGACIYRNRAVLYYSVTILVDADVALIARYLPHPPREPDYRAGREHAAFVRRLADHPGDWTAGRLEVALRGELRPKDLTQVLGDSPDSGLLFR